MNLILVAYLSCLDSSSILKSISKTTQNKISDCILESCKQTIKSEIQARNFVCVMMDDTTDVFDKSQVAVTF